MTTKCKGGAPSSLNDKSEAEILEAIRAVASVSVAAAHAGLPRDTVNGWRRTATQKTSDALEHLPMMGLVKEVQQQY